MAVSWKSVNRRSKSEKKLDDVLKDKYDEIINEKKQLFKGGVSILSHILNMKDDRRKNLTSIMSKKVREHIEIETGGWESGKQVEE